VLVRVVEGDGDDLGLTVQVLTDLDLTDLEELDRGKTGPVVGGGGDAGLGLLSLGTAGGLARLVEDVARGRGGVGDQGRPEPLGGSLGRGLGTPLLLGLIGICRLGFVITSPTSGQGKEQGKKTGRDTSHGGYLPRAGSVGRPRVALTGTLLLYSPVL